MEKHTTKFTMERNTIGELFNDFPVLNVRQVARAIGINETLMQQYVNGAKRPSYERRIEIENYIRELGRRLSNIDLK
jgi:transcriptional regulator with XRE-family HTH domain